MPNWKKVIVSGSDAILNSITSSAGISSSGDIYAPNFIGTSSLATFAEKVKIQETPVGITFPMVFSNGNELFKDNAADFYYNPQLNLLNISGRLATQRISASADIQTLFLTASGLNYPSTDGAANTVITTDGNGNLSFEEPEVEKIYTLVKNGVAGVNPTLRKGTPIHQYDSSPGGTPIVEAADANDPNKMPALGVLLQDLDYEEEGQAIILGAINGVDTSQFNEADVVYVAPGGGYTNQKPSGSNLIQNLGIVTRVDSTNGAGVVYGAGRANDVPNLPPGYIFVGSGSATNSKSVARPLSYAFENYPITSLSASSITTEVITGSFITNDGNNRLITSDGDGTFTAEASLTFNSSTLTVSGRTEISSNNPLSVSVQAGTALDINDDNTGPLIKIGDVDLSLNETLLTIDDPNETITLNTGTNTHTFSNTGINTGGNLSLTGNVSASNVSASNNIYGNQLILSNTGNKITTIDGLVNDDFITLNGTDRYFSITLDNGEYFKVDFNNDLISLNYPTKHGTSTSHNHQFTGSVDIKGNTNIDGNLTINGDITAEQYIINSTVTNVTMSYSSGSTIFGDSIDDTHLFTGSVDISGTLSIPGFSDVSASLAAAVASGDDLGNHTATQDLDLNNYNLVGVNTIKGEADNTNLIQFSGNSIDFNLGGTNFLCINDTTNAVEINHQTNSTHLTMLDDESSYLIYANPDTKKVGIGTNSPSAKLEISGNLNVYNDITSSGHISASGDIVGSNFYTKNLNIFPQTLDSSNLEILSIPENVSHYQGILKETLTLDSDGYGTSNLFKVTSSIESITINPTIIYNPTGGDKTRIKLSLSITPDNAIPSNINIQNFIFAYNFGSVSYSSGFTASNLGVSTISPFLYKHNLSAFDSELSFWDISLSSDSQYLEFKFILDATTTEGNDIGTSNLTNTDINFLIPYELYKF